MITTLSPKIIFIGDYPHYSGTWIDLDDPSTDMMGWDDIKQIENYDAVEVFNIAELIDDFEFVVRAPLLRTQSVTMENISKVHYGRKTDAICTRYNSLSRFLGIYMDETSNKLTSLSELELLYDKSWVFCKDRYGLISNRMNMEFSISEVWISTCHLYYFLQKNRRNNENLRKEFENCVDSFFDIYRKISDRFFVLPFDVFMEWYELKRSFHLSYNEMENRWGHTKWWVQYMEEMLKVNSREYMIKVIDDSKDNLTLNCGIECLAMMLYDSRFKSLEKFFIGQHGITATFLNNMGFPDQFAEYRLLSHLLKNKTIKYLPELFNESYESLEKDRVSRDNQYLHLSNNTHVELVSPYGSHSVNDSEIIR